jgi:3-hydroxymyristoyl/3-hydroxydecanoyl-(acyl carrier protein) dehydratase
MSFLFVDCILERDAGKRAVGVKYISLNDSFFNCSKQGAKPELSPSIVAEALGQLAAWVAMEKFHFAIRPVGGTVSDITISGSAKIGDKVFLESHIEVLDETMMVFSGKATVDGKEILSVRKALAPMLPTDLFIECKEAKKQFENIFQSDKQAESSSHGRSSFHSNQFCFYDQFTECSDEGLVGKKTLLPEAFYFADHFPKKPVFPFSLLLDCYMNAAKYYLKRHLGLSGRVSSTRIRKAKIYHFIEPKDTFVTKLISKGKKGDAYHFSFETTVEGKKVSGAEQVLFQLES